LDNFVSGVFYLFNRPADLSPFHPS